MDLSSESRPEFYLTLRSCSHMIWRIFFVLFQWSRKQHSVEGIICFISHSKLYFKLWFIGYLWPHTPRSVMFWYNKQLPTILDNFPSTHDSITHTATNMYLSCSNMINHVLDVTVYFSFNARTRLMKYNTFDKLYTHFMTYWRLLSLLWFVNPLWLQIYAAVKLWHNKNVFDVTVKFSFNAGTPLKRYNIFNKLLYVIQIVTYRPYLATSVYICHAIE